MATPFQRDVLGLALAMEQGAKKTHHTVGEYLSERRDMSTGKITMVYACALGAALVDDHDLEWAISTARIKGTRWALYDLYPELDHHSSILDAVIYRNDSLGWTPAQIVAWLRHIAA